MLRGIEHHRERPMFVSKSGVQLLSDLGSFYNLIVDNSPARGLQIPETLAA